MKMQGLVALQDFCYPPKIQRHKGDIFNAHPRDARLLLALRRAQLDPAAEPDGPQAETPTTTERDVVLEAMNIETPRRGRGRPRKDASRTE